MILDVVLIACWLTTTVAIAAAALFWLEPQLRQLQTMQARQEKAISLLQGVLEGMSQEMLRFNTRDAQVQQELTLLRERQQRIDLAAPGPRPYSHAIRLVRGGARVEDLVAACGLTHVEAELIASIHQGATSAAIDENAQTGRKAKVFR
jgi:hypothetical protein